MGREFTSRVIKFYDEESVFPFVSWPPSLLHGPTIVGQPFIRNRLIIILHLTVRASLQIYLQSAPVDRAKRIAKRLREEPTRGPMAVGHVTFLPDTLLLEISSRPSNGCLRGYVR